MQTLAAEIAITFVDDATALITGCGRIVVGILMTPIERLANACDVAGVLPQRRSSKDMHNFEIKRMGPRPNAGTPRSRRRRWPLDHRLFSFRSLGNLT
jgi:hypothetical protein